MISLIIRDRFVEHPSVNMLDRLRTMSDNNLFKHTEMFFIGDLQEY